MSQSITIPADPNLVDAEALKHLNPRKFRLVNEVSPGDSLEMSFGVLCDLVEKFQKRGEDQTDHCRELSTIVATAVLAGDYQFVYGTLEETLANAGPLVEVTMKPHSWMALASYFVTGGATLTKTQ